jgi:ABC-type branched-subunit amino acid transport system substrate-binding protein
VLVLAAAVTAAFTASGVASANSAASAKSAACTGPAVKIGVINNVSNTAGAQTSPELNAGLKAAAAALAKSCQLGGSIQFVTCDEKFDPNSAAECGRQMVAAKPIAVYTYSSFGDSYFPTVTGAGIPIIPINATSQQENSNPMSYPLGFPIAALIGEVQLAASTGHKKLALAVLDIPAVQFFVGLAAKAAKGFGMTIVKSIPIPPTATDMSGYAGQVISSGADVLIPIIGPAQLVPLFQGVRQQGASSKQIAFVSSLLTMTPQAISALGSAAHGIVLGSWAWPASYTKQASIRQYVKEMKASGASSTLINTLIGVTAWGGLHTLADALKGANLKPTAANVPKALKTKAVVGLSQKYALNPLNYSKPAFATDPVLSTLRIFSSFQAALQLNNQNKVVPLSPKWLGVLHKAKLKLIA